MIQSKYYSSEQMAVYIHIWHWKINFIPNNGIWRDVIGIFSEMLSWNTVRDSKTVTPIIYVYPIYKFWKLWHQPVIEINVKYKRYKSYS